MKKNEYYSLDNILKYDADYNVIFGERSNGKTFSVLSYGIKHHIDSGYKSQIGLIRRWEEDYKGKNGSQMFSAFLNCQGENLIEKWTKGEYNSIYYFSQRWFLCYINENGEKVNQEHEPFCMGFSITSEEHYKSTSYPNIDVILFDEFITRKYYLPDEFIKFQNLLSTIIRQRDNVKIFMCGNTINKYNPYFEEMGMKNAKNQIEGTIDIYSYGTSALKVACEYCKSVGKSKQSNKYFAFDNPKLQMITNGKWEIDIYPHLPFKYLPKDIKYKYYISFKGELLECKVIKNNDYKSYITFIHKKTTPIKEDNENLVFSTEINPRRNYIYNMLKSSMVISKKIYNFYKDNKVFYQNNEIGEIVRNYLSWCMTEA